jgi:hypothetical protein
LSLRPTAQSMQRAPMQQNDEVRRAGRKTRNIFLPLFILRVWRAWPRGKLGLGFD